MSKILELQKANQSLAQLRTDARAEFQGLSLRDKVKAFQQLDVSFLETDSDGGFLYKSFPGGGWGHILAKTFGYERHQVVETSELIESLYEAWYDEVDTPEQSEEKALKALEEGDGDGNKLLRAVLEAGVRSFVFDW